MNISIDLCIEIDSFDYLIKNLEPIFDGIGYGDYFLTKLEPFILYDRIKDIILNSLKISLRFILVAIFQVILFSKSKNQILNKCVMKKAI